MKSDLVDVSETKKNLVIEIPSEEVDGEIDDVEWGFTGKRSGDRI